MQSVRIASGPVWLIRLLIYRLLGRAWSIQELRQKSWDDLHRLWWVCAKERNRIATAKNERERLKAGYGEYESDNRENFVSWTQSPSTS